LATATWHLSFLAAASAALSWGRRVQRVRALPCLHLDELTNDFQPFALGRTVQERDVGPQCRGQSVPGRTWRHERTSQLAWLAWPQFFHRPRSRPVKNKRRFGIPVIPFCISSAGRRAPNAPQGHVIPCQSFSRGEELALRFSCFQTLGRIDGCMMRNFALLQDKSASEVS
jgi:hypothetical protein